MFCISCYQVLNCLISIHCLVKGTSNLIFCAVVQYLSQNDYQSPLCCTLFYFCKQVMMSYALNSILLCDIVNSNTFWNLLVSLSSIIFASSLWFWFSRRGQYSFMCLVMAQWIDSGYFCQDNQQTILSPIQNVMDLQLFPDDICPDDQPSIVKVLALDYCPVLFWKSTSKREYLKIREINFVGPFWIKGVGMCFCRETPQIILILEERIEVRLVIENGILILEGSWGLETIAIGPFWPIPNEGFVVVV